MSLKVLIPVDGSETSLRGVRHAVDLMKMLRDPIEVDLLNVQVPITFRGIKKHVSREGLEGHYREEGEKATTAARNLLEENVIVGFARESGCRQIIMGNQGVGLIAGLLLGSVATKVASLAEIPVTLVK
jgi:nucleotide-binding universal stress UspA family protein